MFREEKWRVITVFTFKNYALQQNVLGNLSLHDCHAIYVQAVLSSGDADIIDLARELMATTNAAGEQYLKPDESEKVGHGLSNLV